jgi:hypothetical protein
MKSHSSLHGTDEALPLITTFLTRFGKGNGQRRCPKNVIVADEFS